MAGGTWTTSVSSQGGHAYKYSLKLSWNTGSQSIENNTTHLYVTATLDGQWIGWSGTNVNAVLYWWDNRANTDIELGRTTWSSGGWGYGSRTVSADRNILHNSDGTLSGHAWVSIEPAGNAYAPVAFAYGGDDKNQSFPTIPRTSNFSLNADTIELGKDVSLTITPNNSSFSHSLYYQIDNTKTKINDIKAGVTSYKWTVPTELITSITTSSSKQIQLILETFKGTSNLGAKSKDLILTVPDNYVPTINSITITDTNSEIRSQFGFFIQSKSKPKFTVNASGNNGSTIVSTLITFESKSYLNIDTTETIINSGDLPYTIVVTDSRGKTAAQTGTLTVIEYKIPIVTNLSAKRANSRYEVDENDGVYALLGFTYSISTLNNKNTPRFTAQYRKIGGAWTTINTWSEYAETNYIFKGAGNIFSDKTASYEVRFGVKDYFYSDYLWVSTITISSTYTLINFGPSGKSVALFAQSNDEENTLEINGTIKLFVNSVMQSINSIVTRFLKIEEWKQTIASWKQTIASWKANVEEGNTTITLNRYSNYSEEEIDTHTTWIDGKTIYKKTVRTGLISSGTKQKAHGIKNLVTVVKMEGIAVNGSPEFVVLPRSHKDNENDGISLQLFGDYIKIVAGAFNEFVDSYVTVYYTKE